MEHNSSHSLSGRASRFFRERCPPITNQRYLLGFRGFLVIQAFLWVFLQTFVPVAVKDSNNTTGPGYQIIIRKTLSVFFWNESLLYSAFILLSARTICIPFLRDSTKTSVASACFRRGLRLWFPVAIALAIVKITFDEIGTDYIDHFQQATGNISFVIPYTLSSTLVYFNSVFNLFWTTFNFSTQAGSKAFPSQTLWVVNVIYAQSYTVYMTMVIIPYTRSRWRVEASIIFILTAWWVQSWAWYTITGLLFADAVMNMDFKARAKHGVPIWRTPIRIPLWLIYSLLMAAGIVWQYFEIIWRPSNSNIELEGDLGLYFTGGFSGGLDTNLAFIQPQARDENYPLLVGFFLLLESSDLVQRLFENGLFVYLGSRSLSYFLIQSTVIYTLGIKIFLSLHVDSDRMSFPVATVLALIVCLSVTVLGAEIFHRIVDRPSKGLAHVLFDWIRD